MKLLYTVFAISFLYLLLGNVETEKIRIPDESLRFRIIANSNNLYDQSVKYKLKKAIEEEIFPLISSVNNKNEMKEILEDNLSKLHEVIGKTLDKEKYKKPYTISLGNNYFPNKELYGITYEEGYYDSLVITLGNGLGDNWWCVLFPPLCLIEAEESTEVEYKLFVKEILEKYN